MVSPMFRVAGTLYHVAWCEGVPRLRRSMVGLLGWRGKTMRKLGSDISDPGFQLRSDSNIASVTGRTPMPSKSTQVANSGAWRWEQLSQWYSTNGFILTGRWDIGRTTELGAVQPIWRTAVRTGKSHAHGGGCLFVKRQCMDTAIVVCEMAAHNLPARIVAVPVALHVTEL